MSDSISEAAYKQTVANLASFNPRMQVQNVHLENVSIFRVIFQKALEWFAALGDKLAGRTESSLLGRVSLETTYDPVHVLRAWHSFIADNKTSLEKEDLETLGKIHRVFNEFVKRNQTEKPELYVNTAKTEFSTLAEEVDEKIQNILKVAMSNDTSTGDSSDSSSARPTPPEKRTCKTIPPIQRHIKNLSLIPEQFHKLDYNLRTLSLELEAAKNEPRSFEASVGAAKQINDFINDNTGMLMQSPQTLHAVITEIDSHIKQIRSLLTTKQDRRLSIVQSLLETAKENLAALSPIVQ